jgi:DNA-binding CsgD family transcriptional regulator
MVLGAPEEPDLGLELLENIAAWRLTWIRDPDRQTGRDWETSLESLRDIKTSAEHLAPQVSGEARDILKDLVALLHPDRLKMADPFEGLPEPFELANLATPDEPDLGRRLLANTRWRFAWDPWWDSGRPSTAVEKVKIWADKLTRQISDEARDVLGGVVARLHPDHPEPIELAKLSIPSEPDLGRLLLTAAKWIAVKHLGRDASGPHQGGSAHGDDSGNDWLARARRYYTAYYANVTSSEGAASQVQLTGHQRDVIFRLAAGGTVQNIADAFRVHRTTADSWIRGIRSVLNAGNDAEALAHAYQWGVLDPQSRTDARAPARFNERYRNTQPDGHPAAYDLAGAPEDFAAAGGWEGDFGPVLVRLEQRFGERAPMLGELWQYARDLAGDDDLSFCELVSIPDDLSEGGAPFEGFVVHGDDPTAPVVFVDFAIHIGENECNRAVWGLMDYVTSVPSARQFTWVFQALDFEAAMRTENRARHMPLGVLDEHLTYLRQPGPEQPEHYFREDSPLRGARALAAFIRRFAPGRRWTRFGLHNGPFESYVAVTDDVPGTVDVVAWAAKQWGFMFDEHLGEASYRERLGSGVVRYKAKSPWGRIAEYARKHGADRPVCVTVEGAIWSRRNFPQKTNEAAVEIAEEKREVLAELDAKLPRIPAADEKQAKLRELNAKQGRITAAEREAVAELDAKLDRIPGSYFYQAAQFMMRALVDDWIAGWEARAKDSPGAIALDLNWAYLIPLRVAGLMLQYVHELLIANPADTDLDAVERELRLLVIDWSGEFEHDFAVDCVPLADIGAYQISIVLGTIFGIPAGDGAGHSAERQDVPARPGAGAPPVRGSPGAPLSQSNPALAADDSAFADTGEMTPSAPDAWSHADSVVEPRADPGSDNGSEPVGPANYGGIGSLDSVLAEQAVVVGAAAKKQALGVHPPGEADVVELSVSEEFLERLKATSGWTEVPISNEEDYRTLPNGRVVGIWPRVRHYPVLARGQLRVSCGWNGLVSHEDLQGRSWQPHGGVHVAESAIT